MSNILDELNYNNSLSGDTINALTLAIERSKAEKVVIKDNTSDTTSLHLLRSTISVNETNRDRFMCLHCSNKLIQGSSYEPHDE